MNRSDWPKPPTEMLNRINKKHQKEEREKKKKLPVFSIIIDGEKTVCGYKIYNRNRR